MNKPVSQLLRLSCLPFLVAVMIGAFGVGCEGGGDGDSGGSSGDVTLAQYNAIKAHMSYAEVCGIMGRQADSVPVAGGSSYMTPYTWIRNNSDGSTLGVFFHNDDAWAKGCGLWESSGLVNRNDQFYDPTRR